MKVLIACSCYPPYIKGGGEISTKNLAEGLAKTGIEVIVFTIAEQYKEEVKNNVKIYRIKSPNIYWSYEKSSQSFIKKIIWFLLNSYNFRIKNDLLKILYKEKPDIVHTSTLEDISAYTWKVAKKSGYRVIHTLRSYTLLCPKGDMFKNGKNCKRQCLECKVVSYPQKILTKYVDHIVGNSSFTLKKHLEYGYFKKSGKDVIFNIYDNNKVALRKTRKTLILGFIGRIHKTKGLEELIIAFKMIDKKRSIRLIIAGKGEEKYISYIKEISQGYNIEILGFVKAEEFYKKVDVVVMPSLWHEPLARVIYEAFSYGKPVIGSTTGGTGEILINEKTGFLFDINSKDDLFDKINFMYYIYKNKPDIFKDMQEKCLKKSKMFLAKNIVKQYIDVYKRVIKV